MIAVRVGSTWSAALMLVAGGFAACAAGEDESTQASDGGLVRRTPAATGTAWTIDHPEGGFGFGQSASPEELSRWDIDVGPTGSGLPPGGGSVQAGAVVYERDCVACHGATGVEGPESALVGPQPRGSFPFGSDAALTSTIGNYWPYATTLFDYVRRSMPFDRPGALSDDEVYAVTAWLLWMNDLIPEDAVMDASSLPQVVMPAKEFFVPSSEVRLGSIP